MQDINLNLAPHFDDFDRKKSYYRVLFKPGYPVQARELTTLQSILQNQIERFGQHIFKDGSIVVPGQIGYNLNYDAVLVQNLVGGIEVETNRISYHEKTIVGETSKVEAKIITSINASESTLNFITFYVQYTSGGIEENGTQLTKFKNNESLILKENNSLIATTVFENASSYKGSYAYITEGIYFIKGIFIEVPEQNIILEQYSNKPSCKVGLYITESIVNSDDDNTLYDNAAGYSNFGAPGSDRLKLESTLVKQDLSSTDQNNFIELLRLLNGDVISIVNTSSYNELEKNLARRTFDESGNYTVKDFAISVKETLNDGENDGIYSANEVTENDILILARPVLDSDLNAINGKTNYTIEISPGKAYVKGFEIDIQGKRYVTAEKPRNFSKITNATSNLNFGSYFTFADSSSLNLSGISQGDTVLLKNSSSVIIGKSKYIGIVRGSSLNANIGAVYLTDITTFDIFTVIPSAGATALQSNDFLFNSSGASGIIESISNNVVTIYQVSGQFRKGEILTSSCSATSTYTISTVATLTDYSINNLRYVTSGSVEINVGENPKLRNSSSNLFVKLPKKSAKSVSDLTFYSLKSNFARTVVSNSAQKIKLNKPYNFLLVDKLVSSANRKYGTRRTDKEISLGFSDVYKIHAIHESQTTGSVNADLLLDTLTINDSSDIVAGDIIEYNNIRARVLSINSTTVYVKYLTDLRIPKGTSLNYLITIANNPNIVGRVVAESNYGKYKDITDDYSVIKNDGNDSYEISKIIRKDTASIPSNPFIVIFDYFEHGSGDYFSVSSHKNVAYEDIPNTYNSIPYSDIIDYRFTTKLQSIAYSGDGDISNPYSISGNCFDLYSVDTSKNISTSNFPYPGDVAIYDYEYYMGRIDKLYLDENRKFILNQGSSSSSETDPQIAEGSLLLYTLKLPPYVKNIADIEVIQEKNKRYTMKDIGSLDNRLETVEYYTSLNLLEVDTNNLNILDDNSLNRFKNGFIADNFNSIQFCDTLNPDYNVSVDIKEGVVRPYPYVNNCKLNFDSATGNATLSGKSLTLKYSQVVESRQQYASKVINLNPFNVFTWVGEFNISPDRDVWYDTVKTPNPNVTSIDLSSAVKFLYDESGADGNQWGEWIDTGSQRVSGGTQIDSRRTGVSTRFTTNKVDIETETFNGIVSQKYARSIIIDFVSSRLKPNINFYLFADNKNFDRYVYPKLFTNLTKSNSRVFAVGEKISITTTRKNSNVIVTSVIFAEVVLPSKYNSTNSSYTGSSTFLAIDKISSTRLKKVSKLNPDILDEELITIVGLSSGAKAVIQYNSNSSRIKSDSFGNIYGFILVPPRTLNSGETIFKLTDVASNSTVVGLSDSYATANFSSSGSTVSITSNTISFDVPEITSTPISGTTSRFIPDPPPPPPPQRDPVAQSFFVNTEGGIFLTSIDLFFQSKSTSDSVRVQINTVENGVPTSTVVPNGISVVRASNITVSDNATASTTFTFNNPVYLAQGKQYAFIVRSNSLDYKLWISKLGERDITTNKIIDKQPAVGVLFKSANMSTWTEDQTEDIKFVLNRAKFVTTAKSYLVNNELPKVKLPQNAIQMTANSGEAIVLHPNHCMNSINNYVEISGVTSNIDTELKTALGDSQITSESGSTITLNDALLFPTTVGGNPISSANLAYIKIGSEIIAYSNKSSNTLTIPKNGRGKFGTEIESHALNKAVECYVLNGVSLTNINKVHKLSDVVSLDRYKINIINKSTSTITGGGSRIRATRNLQFETITPRISTITLPGTSLSYRFRSITGNSLKDKNDAFSIVEYTPVDNKSATELDDPRVILSSINEDKYFPDQNSLILEVTMSTSNDNITPIIDVNNSSIITTTSKINKIEKIVNNEIVVDTSSDLKPQGSLHDSIFVCKKITLETPATSLKVLIDAIRLQGTDIKVFGKIKRDDDIGNFNSKGYIELLPLSYPVSSTNSNYRSFDFEVSNLPDFKEFSIKIVLISDNQAVIPKFKNFRGIALAT